MSAELVPAERPPTSSGLKGRQRVAAALVALGPEKAGELLKHLSDAEIQAVSAEMAHLRRVPAEVTAAVLDELVYTVQSDEQAAVGGRDFARAALEASLGKTRAEEILEAVDSRDGARPFSFLRKTPPDQIVAFLSEESHQTIALVVASLHSTLAARVLASLPAEIQTDVSLRIATLSEANPDVIRELETGLRNKLANVLDTDLTDTGGVEALAAILNNAGRSTERNVLQAIERTHADLADEIRQLLFTFDDIVNLPDRDVQMVMREIDQKDLALALRGVGEDVREKLMSNLSSRAAELVRDDMETMGPQPKAVVEEAQSNIVAAVRRLEDAGQITLARGEETEVV
ncbi:MAG TPA: flagellar motor switch protein FliG [Solirubrobacteraceae bacterium]